MSEIETITLWRPIGPKELSLIIQLGYQEFPPRLLDQPIFYPVLNEDYARKIASGWNAKRDGGGYVTEFQVEKHFIDRYAVHQVGGETILEYWIPAEDLDSFNGHIVGNIAVIADYPSTQS